MIVRKEAGCELVKMVALLNVGRGVEPKRALAQTTTQLLKKSTTSKNFLELNKAIDFYGASLDIFSSPLYITAELYCIKKHFKSLLPLFFETLYEATFHQADLDILKSQNIDIILQNNLQTDVTADKLLSESLFGKNHILGYYSTTDDIVNIELEDIKEFYTQHISKCLPVFFLAGDIDSFFESEINSYIQQYGLTNSSRSPVNATQTYFSSEIIKHSIPNASQASLRLGSVINHNSLEEYMALDFINFTLGGYYTSELMSALRLKKGYTYGVYSYLLLFDHVASLQIALEADSQYIDACFNEIKKVFNRLQKKGLELDFVLNQFYSLWLRNSEGSLKELSYDIKFYKLGYDYNEFKNNVIHKNIVVEKNDSFLSILNYSNYLKIVVN